MWRTRSGLEVGGSTEGLLAFYEPSKRSSNVKTCCMLHAVLGVAEFISESVFYF
jgi:hypothetical protein